MSNLDPKYKMIFETAVELASAVHDAQIALRQHMADAKEELLQDVADKAAQKTIRKDLAEIKALAMIEAKGQEARQAAGERVERRQRIAHVVGVQLEMRLS